MLIFESFFLFYAFVLNRYVYLQSIRVIRYLILNRNIMKKSTQIKIGIVIGSYFAVRVLVQIIFHV